MLVEFYLSIAKEEIAALDRLSEPVSIGSSSYSGHFRHAAVASVFSAAAVEHAIATVVWVECFLAVPQEHRAKTQQLAKTIRRVSDQITFLRANTSVEHDTLLQMKTLFDRRNRLLHLVNEDVLATDGWGFDWDSIQALNDAGRGAELDSASDEALDALAHEVGIPSFSLSFAGIGTPMLDEARENLAIAERVVEALDQHIEGVQPSAQETG